VRAARRTIPPAFRRRSDGQKNWEMTMNRNFASLPLCAATVILAAVAAGSLGPGPAYAVHECGTPHEGQSGHDQGFGQGCNNLDERGFFYGDPRPDAPELAYRGPYPVGVRTLEAVNPDQIDILSYTPDNPNPLYDRPLTLEVSYPAALHPGERQVTTYDDALGSGPGDPDRPVTPFEFAGRAARGAAPDASDGPYPLVIVSHGYPGSRVLMTYLTENLASKGYIVVSIDHTESTHADKVDFGSTLLNRTLDIHFVLNLIAGLGYADDPGFLAGMVDDANKALVGYSMGGYGALNAAGAGFAPSPNFILDLFVPGGHAARLQAGNPEYLALLDPRIRAVVALAPWGGIFALWEPDGLAGLEVPSLFIVGDQDQTAPYAGVQWLFDNAVSSDRYMLKYQGAIHEVAVNPPPPISEANYAEYMHYQEPAWDNRKINNVNQHFVTAFLGMHLKGDHDTYAPYLDLHPISNESHRTDPTDPTYWKGFTPWAAIGMELHHAAP
jgi:predicted dienelactone hydrolase